jgi:small subunit ribosomal protein S8
MSDPIADMLTQIRNGLLAKKEEVKLPFSKVKFEMAKILEKEGLVGAIKKQDDGYGSIVIKLKYENEQPVIRSLRRISRPGCRIYVTKDKLPIVLNNYGLAIISTSRGLMTNRQAKKERLGGEVICEIY